MQRWEYAELGYNVTSGHHYLIIFRPDNSEVLEIKRDKTQGDITDADARRRMIANLGLEGWELVNAIPSDPSHETLYFKRPLG